MNEEKSAKTSEDQEKKKDRKKDKKKDKSKRGESHSKSRRKRDKKDHKKDRKKRDKEKKKSRKSRSRSSSDSYSRRKKKSRRRDKSRDRRKSKERSRDQKKKYKRRYEPSSSSSSSQKKYISKKKKLGKYSKSKSSSKREKPKRKGSGGAFAWDSPPKDFNEGQEIDLNNPASMLSSNLTSSMSLLQQVSLLNQLQSPQLTKVDRKLYVGNLPHDITQDQLVSVLNTALKKLNINTEPPGDSIIGSWINHEGHYAFVEFRTPEETNNGFALQNIAIFGQQLKIGRPRAYTQAAASGMTQTTLPILTQATIQEEEQIPITHKIQLPSRVLILKNMVTEAELEIDEEFKEIQEEVLEECKRFGEVLGIKIPRPSKFEPTEGVGKIFVKFESIEVAKEARKALEGRTFSENKVECSYHDDLKFDVDNFEELL